MTEDIFPLEVSLFERYMLADDRPTHPMASFLEIELSGAVDVGRLQAALAPALLRHPLLNSLIREDGNGRLHWVPASNPPQIEILKFGSEIPPEPKLDLRRSPGVRIWLRPREGGATLLLYVHHATCDALGMLTFSIDWLLIAAGEDKRLPPINVEGLRSRESTHGMKAAFPLWQRLRNIGRYLFGKPPTPLAVPLKRSPASSPETAYHAVSFSCQESDQIKRAARKRGVSLNDWLTAALFQTLLEWDEQHRTQPSNRPWRLVVPVNRRRREQFVLSACNCIGYKMLTRSPDQVFPFDELLESIHQEMEPVRTNPQGVTSFLKMLRWFDRFGQLQRTVRNYECFATAILSNLGDLDRYFSPWCLNQNDQLKVGSLQVEQIRCAPPRRPNTFVTIVAFSICRQLQLVSSRLGRGLDDNQTLEFLKRFRATILKTLPSPSTMQVSHEAMGGR